MQEAERLLSAADQVRQSVADLEEAVRARGILARRDVNAVACVRVAADLALAAWRGVGELYNSDGLDPRGVDCLLRAAVAVSVPAAGPVDPRTW